MNDNIEEYNDIINLPHHVSKKHPQMTIEERSAQFAPFAALTGYEGQVKETARLTNERKDITDELRIILDEKIKLIQNNIYLNPRIEVKYFIPDSRKNGGRYVNVVGNVKKIDEYRNLIILDNKKEIPISEIIDINGEIFKCDELE